MAGIEQPASMADEDAASFRKRGLIGLQVHQGPPMAVDLMNVRIRELK